MIKLFKQYVSNNEIIEVYRNSLKRLEVKIYFFEKIRPGKSSDLYFRKEINKRSIKKLEIEQGIILLEVKELIGKTHLIVTE